MIQKISILLILLTQFTFAQDAKLSSNSLKISKVSKETLKIAKEIEKAKRSQIAVFFKKTVTQKGFTRFVEKNKWITKVYISNNNENIGDIKVLKKVKGLKKIDVGRLKKSKTTPLDLGPLSNQKQLEEIDFQGTKVANTQALSNCKSLKKINFSASNVSSLEFLYGTPLVEKLNLYGFHTFENYEPVSSLKNIKTLDIGVNKQAVDEKLSALKNLTSLVKFSFRDCRNITKLDFLENCTELTYLIGHRNYALKDISALSKLTKLNRLKLDECKLSDFSILKNCVNLKQLDISETQTKNIDFIESLVNLKILDAYETPIDSISQIKNHPSLKELNISETLIKNIEFIKSLVHLEELNISKTPITSISQIKNHPNLEELNLSYTNISSIKDVMTLSKLKYINIKKTSIKNLKPLLSCPKLKSIKLNKQIHKDFIKQIKKDHPKIRIY